ncbi:MAM and LDL-receptor class A domain-containing [Argiope bruennichi]|uniref:MAM and LDL-receptor class A domain-containing n=1 Tax=Argiope bruennichi TaxID=94029 RepID=A0A8T0E8S2_ARGBR|nr:MAM and LDL-receptor class A domain-containing [Argiope bruennichi]
MAGKTPLFGEKGTFPLPFCVSRGCHRPSHVDNARVTLMYRGAVLTYDCLPGYTLDGGASIYCDGRRWSAEPPTCVVSTTDPQTSCDFEDPDLCGWSHDPTHDFDWKRNQFATPSGHVGTGPSYDHTFGEGKGGFYLFMEASAPRNVNDTARLFSPVYPSEYSGGCFIFWYHMFGSTTGGLRIYVKPESHVFGELPPAWSLYGDQGNHWFRGNVSLPHISENFQIIIEGIRGSSYIGDTAIDDVSLNDADCESIGNSTDNTSETFSDSCRGRCRESANSSACGCNDDCVASRSCCFDFESICTKNTETGTDETKNENSADRTTMPTTHVAIETEIDVSKSVTTSAPETPTPQFIPETTQIRTETTTSLDKSTSINATQPVIFFATTSTEKPTSPTTTSSTSTSTIATTTTTTSTTSSTTTTTTPSTTTTSTLPTKTTTTSTTTPSTTTSTTTPSTTTTTTTPSTTTTTTTTPSTTTLRTTTSTIVSTTSTTSPKPPLIINSSPLFTTTSITTSSPWQTTTTEAVSTRRIYNLRPRRPTTPKPDPRIVTSPQIITSVPPYSATNSDVTSSKPRSSATTRSTSTTEFTTARLQSFTTTMSSKVTIAQQEPTMKFTAQKERVTEKSVIESEAHASKTESVSNAGAPVVTIVSVIIVILICVIIGALFFVKRWKAQKLSKLDDDSEMKFLSENEVVEYSDSSALDRINFNP